MLPKQPLRLIFAFVDGRNNNEAVAALDAKEIRYEVGLEVAFRPSVMH
jgi:hypothetical protein